MFSDRQIRRGKPGLSPEMIHAPGFPYDNYYSRLIKMIPADILAFYLALDSIAGKLPDTETWRWIVFGLALIGAWFYLGQLAGVSSLLQRILTLVALVIWVYVFGGPFAPLPWYNVEYGRLVLVAYTFFLPVFYKGVGDANEERVTSK